MDKSTTAMNTTPPGWELAAVGSLARFSSGQGISVSALHKRSSDYPVPVYGGNGIAGYTKNSVTNSPTVIVGRVGQRCGEVHVTDGPAWITDNALYPTRLLQSLDIQFLGLALTAAGLNDVKNRNDLPLLTQSILHAVRVAWPSEIREQRAIAAVIKDVDALLLTLDQLINKKRDLKQAAMEQLFTGGIRLPEFVGEWEREPLGNRAAIDPDQLRSGTSPDYAFRYISLENVDSGTLRGNSSEIFRTAPSRARRRIRRDDVLVSTVRPNLMSHLWFRDDSPHWVCSTGFAVVRCVRGRSHPGFVFEQLFSPSIKKQIEALLTGSSYPAISSSDVRRLEILFPPYEEQEAIAEVLTNMDAELTILESRREKTRALKQGMMQELLTGRTRLL